jgi:hypothetical protein
MSRAIRRVSRELYLSGALAQPLPASLSLEV